MQSRAVSLLRGWGARPGAEERASAALLARDKAIHERGLADDERWELQHALNGKTTETAAANAQLAAALHSVRNQASNNPE